MSTLKSEAIPVYALVRATGETMLSFHQPPNFVQAADGTLEPIDESDYESEPRLATSTDLQLADFLRPEDDGKLLSLADGIYQVRCFRGQTSEGQTTYSIELQRR
ncbi:MAG: hypothetical protein F6K04_22355 [Leptolyngbya sp. SIO4C5]|uniref:hypothetical protein n=1 Tax=Sphaerothrix gracilis TaxID=3151835 RepID=UPI0013BECBEC|nr:hypothetical protein [Leptolyngbya sp. SIO4C5]